MLLAKAVAQWPTPGMASALSFVVRCSMFEGAGFRAAVDHYLPLCWNVPWPPPGPPPAPPPPPPPPADQHALDLLLGIHTKLLHIPSLAMAVVPSAAPFVVAQSVRLVSWLKQLIMVFFFDRFFFLLQDPRRGDVPAATDPRHPHNSDGSAALGACEASRGVCMAKPVH